MARHLEILVEEPSMEAFLALLLPRLLNGRATFRLHPHRGKGDLLAKLNARLRGYAAWLPEDSCIVVVVDRDADDCRSLKLKMEHAAANAGLVTRTVAPHPRWQVVNRIAIEELEAWYFGDWGAVREVYPRVAPDVPNRSAYRDPDAIAGGTWEALQRILQRASYFSSGIRKVEIVREMGRQLDPVRNRSASFSLFRDTLIEAIT